MNADQYPQTFCQINSPNEFSIKIKNYLSRYNIIVFNLILSLAKSRFLFAKKINIGKW